jgi:hypothetical protein
MTDIPGMLTFPRYISPLSYAVEPSLALVIPSLTWSSLPSLLHLDLRPPTLYQYQHTHWESESHGYNQGEMKIKTTGKKFAAPVSRVRVSSANQCWRCQVMMDDEWSFAGGLKIHRRRHMSRFFHDTHETQAKRTVLIHLAQRCRRCRRQNRQDNQR